MPDLNWSQVRETVLMLELSAVQIETAMKDSNASVEVLTNSFTSMAGYMRMISDTIQTLPDQGEVGVAKQNLSGVSEHVPAWCTRPSSPSSSTTSWCSAWPTSASAWAI